ncbi:hypothetical protein JTE90_022447 [Oedothorax gibbosus]|uniref:Uncharacterized protein n=1 Tax=Oedothorax gibbosus TaxID=931172 RepID=A0AAV6TY83_9ARAC|nr:hypothetical protein JTE90_022447 [Oedothorax gibbosus]
MNFVFHAVAFLLFFVATVRSGRTTEQTQLVTMTKAELLEIVDCISKSQNQATCDRFAVCNNKMPEQVLKAYERCDAEINSNRHRRCNKKEQLFSSVEIPSKIFDCVNTSTKKLNAGESKKMIEFETCARTLYIGSCPSPKRV